MKACLVACGYKDLNNLKTDSPTCNHECNVNSLCYYVAGGDSLFHPSISTE